MGDIRQYMAWAEKRIARVVMKAKIHVGVIKVIQGPLTITFRVRLIDPTRQDVNTLLGLGDAMAEAIQAEAVRIVRSAGAFSIEIPSPLRRTPTSAELLRHSKGMKVCVGLDSLRQPAYIEPREHGAILWVGPSRHGKTSSMKCTLFCMAKQLGRLKFMIFCHERKRADWAAFDHAAGCMGIITDPQEHLLALKWVTEKLMKLSTPFTFVVLVDDLLNLLEESPEMASHLARISSMGAGLGIHLMAGTQVGGSKAGTGGEGVESNASGKILYKATSKARAARNAGQGEIDLTGLTDAKGDAVLLSHGTPLRIATGKADDRDIMMLPAGAQYERPWLHETAPKAGTESVLTRTNRPSTSESVISTLSTSELDVPEFLRGTTAVRPVLPPSPSPQNGSTSLTVGGVGRPISTPDASTLQTSYRKLADAEPDAADRAYLRKLFRECRGNKSEVLRIVWGGVVNEEGKTPKTWKWLMKAVEEGGTEEEAPAAMEEPVAYSPALLRSGKEVIDMNTPEGRAKVDALIESGVLPKDDISTVVRFNRKG